MVWHEGEHFTGTLMRELACEYFAMCPSKPTVAYFHKCMQPGFVAKGKIGRFTSPLSGVCVF